MESIDSDLVEISTTCLSDNRLSWRSKGLLLYMLTMPKNWEFSKKDLLRSTSDGNNRLQSTLKELKRSGYILQIQTRKESGRYERCDTCIFGVPNNFDSLKQPKGVRITMRKVKMRLLDINNYIKNDSKNRM